MHEQHNTKGLSWTGQYEKLYCDVQIHKGFALHWIAVDPGLTGDGVRFPTKCSVTRLGNDGDFCIRPIKVSPEFHGLISYAYVKINKTDRVIQEGILIYFV